MLGRHTPGSESPLALTTVENGAEDPSPSAPKSRWKFWSRRPSGPPAAEGRSWIHPSELPNFDRIPTYDTSRPRRRHPRLTLALGVCALAAGAVALILHSSAPPTTAALGTNVATSISQIPSYAQNAARSTIEIVADDEGHITTTSALVIAPGNLAITTDPLAPASSMTGSSQSDLRFPVTLVTTDRALGFSIVRLGSTLPAAPTNVLPASAAVLALSPVFGEHRRSPAIEWADTTLGDPVEEVVNGVVSYQATPSANNLHGFADTIAVDNEGDVVAVLSANNEWYSAQYITDVAQAVTANGGCHGQLGILGTNAQGGGVLVSSVTAQARAAGLHPGDIVTTYNGAYVDSLDTLLSILYAARDHASVTIGLLRHGVSLSTHTFLTCQP